MAVWAPLGVATARQASWLCVVDITGIVPVKLVGLGEGPDDLAPFEPEVFVSSILGE